MVEIPNKAHILTDYIHKINDLHEYRLLTFPYYREQIVILTLACNKALTLKLQ